MDEWVTLIQTLGFPIFVCVWFMWRTESIIKENTAAINQLAKLVEKLCERIDGDE